jgi:hypothetical protein
MDKRLIALSVLTAIVWLDAVVENHRLASSFDALAHKADALRLANEFYTYVYNVAYFLPLLPTHGVSPVALEMFVTLRDDILAELSTARNKK